MMKKGCWTMGILLAGMRYTGLPPPVLPGMYVDGGK